MSTDRDRISTEHLLREFYNDMYRIHTQPGNIYDMADHLHHLTVHKHLDQDPLIQFREAFRWVDHSGARLVADAGCGYGGFGVFVARRAPTLVVDGYTLSDVQQAIAQQVIARLQLSRSRVLVQSYDRLERRYDAVVAIESLGHSPNVASTLHHWARKLRPGGVIVIIDELFRPQVQPAHPEIQQFMQSWHYSLLLQRAPVEAMLHAAGLSVAAWVVLSERYHVRTRPDEECDRLLHTYKLHGAHRGYIGGILLEKFYNRGWVDYVLLVLTAQRAASRSSVRKKH
jgi:cyclopropane fatty-acyl-phospholipid synthase-like methyltransferase